MQRALRFTLQLNDAAALERQLNFRDAHAFNLATSTATANSSTSSTLSTRSAATLPEEE